MTPSVTAPSVSVAGWTVAQLDFGAIHAPLTWVDPQADETELAWLPSTGLLCHRDDDVVLVDCGLGPFSDVFGLPIRHVEPGDALASAGYSLGDVAAVVLTHLDADHAGGIVSGGDELRATFPGAGIVVSPAAADLLLGREPARWDAIPGIGATLLAAGVRIEALADGVEAASGLTLRSAPGHRVGHVCVELAGNGERFVYLADVIHARQHVEHPEWDFLHDSDPDTGLVTRRALIEELAGTGAVIACSHVTGFGTIERRRDGVPVWADLA